MSLPKEIRNALEKSPDVEPFNDYFYKLPTLNTDDYPDNVTLFQLKMYCSGLRGVLKEAGLSEGQRGGVTRILRSTTKVGEYYVTVGDVRKLSFKELLKLRRQFTYDTPTERSLRILKKLCGQDMESVNEDSDSLTKEEDLVT